MSAEGRFSGSMGTRLIATVLLALGAGLAFGWRDLHELDRRLGAAESRVDSLAAAGTGPLGFNVSPLLLDFQLDLPGRGEVFPAMSAGGAPDYWPVAMLRMTNSSDRAAEVIVSAEIPGWSRRTEQSVLLAPGQERTLEIRPDLLSRAFVNREISRAALEVRVTSPNGIVLHVESRSVLMHPGSEIYWGRKFANAQMAARWVTPHASDVLDLVARAREHQAGGRLAGYSRATGDSVAIARHVRAQAKAIFLALRGSKISYVSGLFVMGEFVGQAQRIRLPAETLHLGSANCMDLAVVFASAMESLGMEPLLVILPGHALAGVRLGEGAADALYLDLTVLPGGGFEEAIQRARRFLKSTEPARVLVVDVASARAIGIYPLAADVPS